MQYALFTLDNFFYWAGPDRMLYKEDSGTLIPAPIKVILVKFCSVVLLQEKDMYYVITRSGIQESIVLSTYVPLKVF